ncbi:cytochrome c3 family protein, partial [Thermodesulfobacteriota bacterium]
AMLLLLPEMAFAQEEVASALRRYKQYEVSTGYYEEYEMKPRRERPFVEIPGVRRGIFRYSPSAASVRIRTRLADSHSGIKFYDNRRCEDCHVEQTRDLHTVRANLTCRQCHGGEPVASIDHYFSPMNSIRKHAYVCAKCHEGASASYASYVVHVPNPSKAGTQKTFPVLFYVFWFMIVVAVGTFVVFLPHTVLWGIRELFVKKEKASHEPGDQE